MASTGWFTSTLGDVGRFLEDEFAKCFHLCHGCHCLLGVVDVASLQRCGLFPAPSSLRLPTCMGTQFVQLIRERH